MATITRPRTRNITPVITSNHQELLTPVQVSELLQIPVKTLAEWRFKRNGLNYYKVGRYVRYRLEDVNAFLAQQVHEVGEYDRY